MFSDVLTTSAGILGLIAGAKLLTSENLLEPDKTRQLDKVSEQIADYDPELFDSLVNITTLLMQKTNNQDALQEITHALGRLITLDKHIFDLPRRRDWWLVAIEYKHMIMNGLVDVQTHVVIQEEDLTRVKKVTTDLTHNVRLNNEIIFEDQISKHLF